MQVIKYSSLKEYSDESTDGIEFIRRHDFLNYKSLVVFHVSFCSSSNVDDVNHSFFPSLLSDMLEKKRSRRREKKKEIERQSDREEKRVVYSYRACFFTLLLFCRAWRPVLSVTEQVLQSTRRLERREI